VGLAVMIAGPLLSLMICVGHHEIQEELRFTEFGAMALQEEERMEQIRRGFLAIASAASIAALLSVACHLKRLPDVQFQTTPQEVVEEMLEMAKVTKDDIVYDLGCGDGRFVITAAKKYGARGVGIDIDPLRIRESQKNATEAGVTDLVRFIEDDLFTTPIHEATVIILYLLPELNLKLRPKLLRELSPGARIVSYSFDMDDWKPDATRSFRSPTFSTIFPYYVWVIPADVKGVWRWSLSIRESDYLYTLRFEQSFQKVSGYVTVQEGRQIRIEGAELIGDRLNFAVRYRQGDKEKVAMQFKGRVKGGTIQGNVEVTGGTFDGTYPWTAIRNER
jgi:SAM-dependent methyltransferase